MQSQADTAPHSLEDVLLAADAYRETGAKCILALALTVWLIMDRLTDHPAIKKNSPLILAVVSRGLIMNVLVHTGLKVPWTDTQLLPQYLPNA
ncbi:hypothetical protein Slin14017_G082720 [Septoria linicola]|nr:hypothetical protein Slin14017_G082720 [Septoria linicola]